MPAHVKCSLVGASVYGADYGGEVGAGMWQGRAISFFFSTYEGGKGEKLITAACRDLAPGVSNHETFEKGCGHDSRRVDGVSKGGIRHHRLNIQQAV